MPCLKIKVNGKVFKIFNGTTVTLCVMCVTESKLLILTQTTIVF